MKTTEIAIEDPLEMIWAIREQIHEETKNMTREERRAYNQQKVEEFEELKKQIKPDDYDLSFLHKK